MNAVATKLTQCSATAFSGDKLLFNGSQSRMQLQQTLKGSEYRQASILTRQSQSFNEITQFKETVFDSHLPKITPFSERKKQPVSVLLMVNDKVKEIAIAQELPRSSHEKNESPLSPFDIADEAREYTIGKIGHKLKHKYGDSTSHWFELGIIALLGHIPENSKSPWRDHIISADVNITLAETLSLCLPARLPAYLAIAGAKATEKVAQELEVYVDKLAQNQKFAELWNTQIEYSEQSLSFSESIALCKFTLKAAQVPSELYDAIHHRVFSAASQTADALGITDDNLIYIAKKTLSLLAKYSPEIMEENVWRNAILDMGIEVPTNKANSSSK
jgi:hypothetical protein